ncbi:MAG: NifB/NifX family molybdenum-iron cluster-binding protein [Dehalobacterium sp.]
MKIAFTTDESSIDAIVSKTFEESNYLLVVETDDLSMKIYRKTDNDGIDYAKKIIEDDCEAVITGTIEEKAFELLATACVSRMKGTGHTVKDALVLMDAYKLEIIRDFNGSTGKHQHAHTAGCCNCDDHCEH